MPNLMPNAQDSSSSSSSSSQTECEGGDTDGSEMA